MANLVYIDKLNLFKPSETVETILNGFKSDLEERFILLIGDDHETTSKLRSKIEKLYSSMTDQAMKEVQDYLSSCQDLINSYEVNDSLKDLINDQFRSKTITGCPGHICYRYHRGDYHQ